MTYQWPFGELASYFFSQDTAVNDGSGGVEGRSGQGRSAAIEDVGVAVAHGSGVASAPPSIPAPTTNDSPGSGAGAEADRSAERTGRVEMNAGQNGCGLSLPLIQHSPLFQTRDGKQVLLGLAVVAILMAIIALVYVVVQNKRKKRQPICRHLAPRRLVRALLSESESFQRAKAARASAASGKTRVFLHETWMKIVTHWLNIM
ncbi:hypothetical protein K488DRAFT_72608 [Vararia minispora EC-137]|uniref:Uncharacterized protein n=1 Tax=Vararia minispora EC-137 TaxID=1314806 RepID=A0ACB8QDS3_9AGAM|nr:hypothetical protein K488DRAFT_72608 [Vararia minispora EC-137]